MKYTLLLGEFIFEEEPLRCTIVRLDNIILSDIQQIDELGEYLISKGFFESYCVVGQYRGEIIFEKI